MENVKLSDIIREQKDRSRKYIDSIQATMPGMTGRKIFGIREQVNIKNPNACLIIGYLWDREYSCNSNVAFIDRKK